MHCCNNLRLILCAEKKGRVVVASPDSHALETFQRVMKRQCDALIALGFDPSVKVSSAKLVCDGYTYVHVCTCMYVYVIESSLPTI